jgi:hypothetical protein
MICRGTVGSIGQMLSTVIDARAVLKLRACPTPLRCAALRTLATVAQAFMRLGMGTAHQDEGPMSAKRHEVAKALKDCHSTAIAMLAPKEDALVKAEAYRLLGQWVSSPSRFSFTFSTAPNMLCALCGCLFATSPCCGTWMPRTALSGYFPQPLCMSASAHVSG